MSVDGCEWLVEASSSNVMLVLRVRRNPQAHRLREPAKAARRTANTAVAHDVTDAPPGEDQVLPLIPR